MFVKKTRQQVPNGVAYAKPPITKLRLNSITVPSSPRKGILTQSLRNCLVRTS